MEEQGTLRLLLKEISLPLLYLEWIFFLKEHLLYSHIDHVEVLNINLNKNNRLEYQINVIQLKYNDIICHNFE